VTVVRVTEVPGGADGAYAARVAFGDVAEYEVTVRAPGDAAAERLLAWYFEEHLRFPFLDRDLERQAAAALAGYGRELFGQVLGGVAAHDYRRLRERAFDGCRLEVTGSAGFHLLHWEALRDPDMDVPLSVRLPVTRRVARLPSAFELPSGQPALRILLVTARPFGEGTVTSYCPSCSRCFGWIWLFAIGAGPGAALMLLVCQRALTFGAAQCRRRGLVLRAAGLRWPDCPMRARHSAWTWSFQGMCSRPPWPRRAVSWPVSIQ
jgi:hypothetical protein